MDDGLSNDLPSDDVEAEIKKSGEEWTDISNQHSQYLCSKNIFKAVGKRIPSSKLTKRQCPMFKDLDGGGIEGGSSTPTVTLIDARFKDIRSYQVRYHGIHTRVFLAFKLTN